MTVFHKVKRFHQQNVQPLLGTPRGCDLLEIDELERSLGEALPATYRDYLLWMGRDYEGAFQGSACFIDSVLDNNSWLPKFFDKHRVEIVLPEKYVTFFRHQGYRAAWFALPNKPDPICWYFSKGETDHPIEREALSDFVLWQLKALLPAVRDARDRST